MILNEQLHTEVPSAHCSDSAKTTLTSDTSRGGVNVIDDLAPQWRQLCGESLRDEPFYRPEWVGAYVRAFEPQSTVLLATASATTTAHDTQQLRAVLALVEKETWFCGFPVKMLQGAANAHSCRFDLVRAPGVDGDIAVQRIWNVLRDRADWDLIELPFVPQEGAAESLLGAAERDGYLTGNWESIYSAYIPLVGVKDSVSVARDSHFRQNLKRRLGKAKKLWPVELTCDRTADAAALRQFYDVESSGWKGKGKSAIACADATRRFYDEVARVAAHFGYGSIYLLRFGDNVAAGHFGLSYKGRYYSPKVAYNEEYAAYGPGHLIIEAILRDILPQNFDEFDFLGNWMPWKGEWARHGRTHSSCYIFRPGLLGHALYSLRLKLFKALRPIVRRARNQSRTVGPEDLRIPQKASAK